MSQDADRRLQEIARIAVKLEAETGCPAQLMIAQWALESNWGAKPVGHANYFGVKRAARHAKFCTVPTHEVIGGKSVLQDLEFADYDSLEDSARDYCWLITKGLPYRAAWSRYQLDGDVMELICGIAGVYATSPSYARLVSGIAGQGNITKALDEARAA